ncbi:MAG: dihydrodipicolinate synthase family protein, partial [Clostridia bacterium]|nr:dihydrodipicolinate synthase family protein [Clostridia bacterium]
MKNTVFTGAGVAIITPFRDGKIDYEDFARIIEFQIANHTDAIIVCGTTGESSTLTDDEHVDAIEFAVKQTAGRVPVIAGTGSNDTAYAIWLSK